MTPVSDKYDRCATIAKRLRQPLAALANIVDPGTYYDAFKFSSLSELGTLLGDFHPNGHHGRRYDKSSVLRFNTGERHPTPDTITAYGLIADQILSARTHGRIRLRLQVRPNRKWRLVPEAICRRCPRTFSPKDLLHTLCPYCLRRKHRL